MSNGNTKLAVGLALGIGAGLAIGYLLPTGEDVAGLRGDAAGARETAGADPEALAAAKAESGRLAAEVAALQEKLAVREHAPAVVAQPSDTPPLKPATEKKAGKTGDAKVDWDAKKKAALGKGKGGRRGKGGKGRSASTEPPEGMTREQWDDAVRVIVDGHNWRESLTALRRLGEAKSSGQPMEPEDLQQWEATQETWGALREVGVSRNDPRVLRATVPGRVSAMGANLNASQAAQLGITVEDLARREAARPAPNVPERFATATARQVRNVIALEAQMGTLLSADQFQAYLAEVGDDPFASGWQVKPWQLNIAGTAAEVASRALGHWSNYYDVTDAGQREVLSREASAFAAAAAAVPGPVAGLDTAGRRRAILERTARVAELQGEAEQRFLTTGLGLAGELLAAALARQAPVFIVAVE